MDTQKEILTFLQNNQEVLKNKYHVSKIGLFGSFARDEATKDSDVDLIVELDDGIENIHDVKTSLKEYLSQAFDRSVDLAREKYLKPYAREQILKDTVYV